MDELDRRYPALAHEYRQTMNRNTIALPPRVLINDAPNIADALYGQDTIRMNPLFVEHMPRRYTLGVIAHEAGHIIAPHDPLLAVDLERELNDPTVRKGKEHEADRIAVHLTGSHDDIIGMRRWLTRAQDVLVDPSEIRSVRRETLLHYGTQEEMEKNIRSVDLKDRSHIDRLIAERNEHYPARKMSY